MIHNVSIAAHDPAHVAAVLAELMDGRSYQVTDTVPPHWIAVSGDEVGTMIEVRAAEGADTEEAAPPSAFHMLLSVRTDLGTIERIGAREGWRTRLSDRGEPGRSPVFRVIEVWVENRVMLELVPEEMMDGYMEQMQLPALDDLLPTP